MGMTAQEWYAAAEKMTVTEHLRMQKTGDPIIRSALREIVNQEGGKFGQVKKRFLDGEIQTVCLVLAQIEYSHPGRFDAFAHCDGCRKFMLHEYDGPVVNLGHLGHWPTFLGGLGTGRRDEVQ